MEILSEEKKDFRIQSAKNRLRNTGEPFIESNFSNLYALFSALFRRVFHVMVFEVLNNYIWKKNGKNLP